MVRFNAATPSTATTAAVGALTAREALVGIDFRPQTGQLMGLGVSATANAATLDLLDPQSGAATPMGTLSQIAFASNGTAPIDIDLATAQARSMGATAMPLSALTVAEALTQVFADGFE